MTDQKYKYSTLSILFAKVGIAFFILMILLGILLTLIARQNIQIILLEIVCILVFLIGVWGSFKWFKKMKGHIIISNDGISEYCLDEEEVFVPWTEVRKVKYGRIFGGLTIVSNSKECVHIMQGIEQPEAIEKALFSYCQVHNPTKLTGESHLS